MLTKHQKQYLETVPEGKVAHIVPFDPAVQAAAREIMAEIKSAFPLAQIFYIGSSALGIAGENDIDVTVFAGEQIEDYIKVFERLYGNPVRKNANGRYAKWEFVQNGFSVELHLDDVMKPYFQEQLATQKLLEENEKLRFEYEMLKQSYDGMPWKEYMKRKYEFWNKILGLESDT